MLFFHAVSTAHFFFLVGVLESLHESRSVYFLVELIQFSGAHVKNQRPNNILQK